MSDIRKADSSDWFMFFFSWLVAVFVLLFEMSLSSSFVNELLAAAIRSENFNFHIMSFFLSSALLVTTFLLD